MHRRTYLGLAAGAMAGLAGCTASALPGPDPTPTSSVGGCPDLVDADRSVCPGDTAGSLAVELSAETVSGDDWTLAVTVTNRATAPYGFNPYAWSVYRADEDGWDRVAPDAHIEPWRELDPGASYTWQLSATEGAAGEADQRVFLDLDHGRHAFVITFDGADRAAAVAPFTVTG